MGSFCHRRQLHNVLWENTWGPFDTARVQAAQNLKGQQIYLLSVFLFLVYLIKTTPLVNYFFWALSYCNPETTLHHLSQPISFLSAEQKPEKCGFLSDQAWN